MNRPPSTTGDGFRVDWLLRLLPRALCCCLLASALLLAPSWLSPVAAMRQDRIARLRDETVDMFYHGFDNYMRLAFPEDELRPVSCSPLTRDPHNSRNFELNDVLGNYSLTLIDSLSTLAILASAPPGSRRPGSQALQDFQDGVAALVHQYGDGRPGPSGHGQRGRGFDVNSKVQVFETVIRGVGGLLSAHLFAVGELPIDGYDPGRTNDLESHPIPWRNGFRYDGQLLRLALDLAQRLLPAFYTPTGLPYPRVNLRYGIPFYVNSPLHKDLAGDGARVQGAPEITETCSAGAGSLVLEFTALSRLTGDQRFEQAAKRAFWAVWERRSNIGLIGAGVDAEGGQWIGSYAGIGAGADSFFEYAFKTYILLSGHNVPNQTVARPRGDDNAEWLDPNDIYTPLSLDENSPDSFLHAWREAHTAIKRHLYTKTQHPHYINANLATGSPQAFWIDSLGAYYAGLLTLAGELEEAIETNLLYAALWTRFSALPERWSIRDRSVEGGLGWWPGRPEFIESTYHLFRATKDPWYLYVGEMVLRDITQKCWTECGWAGIQDVRTGEKSDRMESFFLGETAKYMYLLFDDNHPLNTLDASFVFTTEGHPLIIPPARRPADRTHKRSSRQPQKYFNGEYLVNDDICPRPPVPATLTGSIVSSRQDLFHASRLIGLHNVPNFHSALYEEEIGAGTSCLTEARGLVPDGRLNHTRFPWTLPEDFLPCDGTCAKPPMPRTLLIEFPATTQQNVGSAFNYMFGSQGLSRLGPDGVLVQNIPGLKMTLLEEDPSGSGLISRHWRVVNIGGINLGRDEKVFLPRELIAGFSDPLFNKVREVALVDIVFQLRDEVSPTAHTAGENASDISVDDVYKLSASEDVMALEIMPNTKENSSGASIDDTSLLNSVMRAIREPGPTREAASRGNTAPDPRRFNNKNIPAEATSKYRYESMLGVTPTGAGAGPLPDVAEAPSLSSRQQSDDDQSKPLSWTSMYAAGQACEARLPDTAARDHQLIVMRRGGCSFSEKLENIPAYTPGAHSLQMVLVVSDDHDMDPETGEPRPVIPGDVRPLLEQTQRTPSGMPRRTPISMLLVHGGDETYNMLTQATSIGMRRRYMIESQDLVVANIIVL